MPGYVGRVIPGCDVKLSDAGELLTERTPPQRRFGPERHWAAIAECPLPPIAVGGPDITVDVEAAIMVRAIGPGAVDQIGIPQGEIARLEREMDRVRSGETDPLQRRVLHLPAEHVIVGVEIEVAEPVAAGNEGHAAGLRPVRIDREPGLDIGGGEVAIAFGRPAEARILVPGEVTRGARRLPVDLVDDLLDVPPDQRLQQGREARIEPHRVEGGAVIGRPLHHLDPRPGLALCDLVEEVAVPEAAAVRHALGVDGVDLGADRRHLSGREEGADDGITVPVPGLGVNRLCHRSSDAALYRPARLPSARLWPRR